MMHAALALACASAVALRGALPAGTARLSSAVRMVAAPVRPVALGPMPKALPHKDKWIASVDLDEFQQDVRDLGRRLKAEQGEADVAHLRKIVSWSNMFGVVGVLTCVLPPNPVTVLALSLWTFSRWTMIAHHTCHSGYNGLGDDRWNSRTFAVGSPARRARDWFDWMLPEAWNVEHNNLHHYRLGEGADPDLVERNLQNLREWDLPLPVKRLAVAAIAGIWKWYYYAPNTYKQLKLAEARRTGDALTDCEDEEAAFTVINLFDKGTGVDALDFLGSVMLPYFFAHFVLLPLPFVAAGAAVGLPVGILVGNAIANLVLADILSNLHSFAVIATNHAGGDLYRFVKGPPRVNSGTFFMRAVTSSANFPTGGDVNDFLHGWLNYQIEHHAWPNLSMLSYQKAAPELRALCAKHGVPYVQENVFERVGKLTDIMIGKDSMRVYDPSWEKEDDFVAA